LFSVVLYQPEIPPNTGNVIRLCANTGCELNLVEPIAFSLDDRSLRRAGLDYHDMARVSVWPDLESFRSRSGRRILTFSTRHQHDYTDFEYRRGDVFLFGSESRGLPVAVRESVPEAQRLRIPMLAHNRSLNLSNCVAIVVYEAWRQCGFAS
jgi:tRNA (cytidine/uridine-2'-O-)-methyltransferase